MPKLKVCYEDVTVDDFRYPPSSVLLRWSYLAAAAGGLSTLPAEPAEPGRAVSSAPRSARSTACSAPLTAAASSPRSVA